MLEFKNREWCIEKTSKKNFDEPKWCNSWEKLGKRPFSTTIDFPGRQVVLILFEKLSSSSYVLAGSRLDFFWWAVFDEGSWRELWGNNDIRRVIQGFHEVKQNWICPSIYVCFCCTLQTISCGVWQTVHIRGSKDLNSVFKTKSQQKKYIYILFYKIIHYGNKNKQEIIDDIYYINCIYIINDLEIKGKI